MLKHNFVFAVSLVAMFIVGIGSARADIPSTVYVQQGVKTAKDAADSAQTSANNAQASANTAQAAAEAAQASADAAAASAKTANDTVATKFNKTSSTKNAIVTTDGSGNVAPVAIVDDGSGTYVTDVTVSGGKVTLSRGTPTIPTVNNATLTIKNGATNANLATFTANSSDAATATIPAATPSVAGLAKYGQIPSGSATSTTYATIWVE